MVYDNIFPILRVTEELERLCGSPVAWIPFSDCMENTSYYISEDGSHVFVGISFAEHIQIKAVSIYPAGFRSANSVPVFKRRNVKGSQCYASVPSAVYGAFILKDRLPNFHLRCLDGNLNNCNLHNLAVADDTPLAGNLTRLSKIYRCKFRAMVHYCMWFRSIRKDQAEDFVSDAFIRMCLSRNEVKESSAERLWRFLIKESLYLHRSRNRLVYDVYDLIDELPTHCSIPDENAQYKTLHQLLPQDCARVADLIMEGYNQYQIAKILGCSQARISNLLKKSKFIIQHEQ